LHLLPNLLREVTKVPSFAPAAKGLLTDILTFLKKHHEQKVIERFLNFQQTTASFADFRERLNELVADVHFVGAVVAQADAQQDELDDFEAQQVINREQLSPNRSQAVNKQLQSEAPREFTGFVETDFSKLVLEGILGGGAFGVVHKSRWNGMAVAVQVANCSHLDEITIKLLRRELRVHASPQVWLNTMLAEIGLALQVLVKL
jgi:hypothetical protein